MTLFHLKTGVEPTYETSCVSDMYQTMDDVQQNISLPNNETTIVTNL
jgi:hypothetical protein